MCTHRLSALHGLVIIYVTGPSFRYNSSAILSLFQRTCNLVNVAKLVTRRMATLTFVGPGYVKCFNQMIKDDTSM